jgi:periplasmic protein TonB
MPRPAPPPPTAPPHPPAPPLRLPRERRRPGGTVASVLLHGTLLLALVWRGAQLLGGGEGAGPRGGGGGGGGPAVHYFTLPSPAAAPTPDVPAPERVAASEFPVPDPAAITLPPLETPPVALPAAAAPATGAGTGAGPGSGPGTGGGQGSGTGPGTGSGEGPGTGGDGGYIFRAEPITWPLPPLCARGQFTLIFAVEADGRVSRVRAEPLPKDESCRAQFLDRMKDYKFRPARTRSGLAVASVDTVHIQR